MPKPKSDTAEYIYNVHTVEFTCPLLLAARISYQHQNKSDTHTTQRANGRTGERISYRHILYGLFIYMSATDPALFAPRKINV